MGFLAAAALAFVVFGVSGAGAPSRGLLGWVRFIIVLGLNAGGVVLPVCGAVAAGFLMVRRLNRPPLESFCHCGYDLTAKVSGVCPECGTKIENAETPLRVRSS